MSNAVDNPILNSPWREPACHWDFRQSPPKRVDGRRPAGYHGTVRTEQMSGAQATHPFFELKAVNEIRHRVASWRDRRYPNVTSVTRDLLDHWQRPDRQPLFFCQREAIETIVWLAEATPADRQGIEIPPDVPLDAGYAPLIRYCTKMATGSGKTIVMAMVAAWSVLNKLSNRQDARFSDAVLIVTPNLTVKERLSVLDPRRAENYFDAFDIVPRGYRDTLARARICITNWHAFTVRDDAARRSVVQRGPESDSAFAKRVLSRDLGNAQNILVLNDEAHHAYRPAPQARETQAALEGMSSDERREAEDQKEEATVWVGGLDRINKARGIKRVIDVSATPFYIGGSGHPEGTPLPWIVSDFGLVDAIESGITKIPRVPVADDSGRPDPKYFQLWREIMNRLPMSERESVRRRAKPDSVWREAHGACAKLAAKWHATLDAFQRARLPVPPAMIVVTANTTLSRVVAEAMERGDVLADLAGEHAFAIDSRVLAEAEAAEEGGTADDERQRLRMKVATVGKARWPDDKPPEGWEQYPEPPGKNVRCVISVGMLTEGWDATNVTQILGLRAFGSQLLCEQVVGRGLRRMNYQADPQTGMLPPEYCDVFGIPFEVVPVQATQPGAQPETPSTLVQAVPDRKHLAIDFPRVEGFVRDVRRRVHCDVDQVQPLRIDLQVEPSTTLVETDLGWAVGTPGSGATLGNKEVLTRGRFHDEHRLQRTLFEIARDVTEKLAAARADAAGDDAQPTAADRLLFPQVLDIVRRYVDARVDVDDGARIEDLALASYRSLLVERLLTAIEPATDEGESTLLPRIERFRRLGSTADVQFRTWKPTQPTQKSHVSHVVLDSSWEGAVATSLESLATVVSYARNERLDFEILYEWKGDSHKYTPDFIVCVELDDGRRINLLLEVKGQETEQDRAKWTAARQWCRAVNNHGAFGLWDHRVTHAPDTIARDLEQWKPDWASLRLGRAGSIAPPPSVREPRPYFSR